MFSNVSQENKSLKYFFVLIFILSVPIWLIGGKKLPLPVNLPVSALTAFIPMIAACILSYKQDGFDGIQALLKKAWDADKIKDKTWYLPILIVPPLIYTSSFAILRFARLPLPDSINIAVFMLPVFFAMYWITGAGEELGWSGFAIEPMQNRWGPLKASFILGVIWAVWHSIAFLQTQYPGRWVVWQCIKTVAMRMMIVWIYNQTGKSVFAANLYHTLDNVSWSLFPNYGSHYDPGVTGLINLVLAVIIIFEERSNCLTRYWKAKASRS